MSQEELAEKLARVLGKERIDPTSITRLERGTRTITVNELVALSQILSVSVSALLASDDSKAGQLAEVLSRVRDLDQATKTLRKSYRIWRGLQAHLRAGLYKADLAGLDPIDRELIERESSISLEEVLKRSGPV